MVTRSLNPAGRGVQGIRGVAGARVGATDLDMRYRLDVVAPTVLDAVKSAGGWIYDRVMAGWDVTVLVGSDDDLRPLQILGAATLDLDTVLAEWEDRPHPQTVAVAAELFDRDPRVLAHVRNALEQGRDRGDALGRAPARRARPQRRFRASPFERCGKGVQGARTRRGQRCGGRLRRPQRDVPVRDVGLGCRGPDPRQLAPRLRR